MRILLLLALLLSWQVNAAPCRALSAATVGSQTGFEKDKKAAEAWSAREEGISNDFEQCIGELSTAVTVPTLPDLSQLFNRIKQQVCNAAKEKVRKYIPSKIDPWGNMPNTTTVPVNVKPGDIYRPPPASKPKAVSIDDNPYPFARYSTNSNNPYPFARE